MEHYKTLIMYTISNGKTRTALEELLIKHCFEPLNDQSTYGLKRVVQSKTGLATTLLISTEKVSLNGIESDNNWVK